MVTRNKNDERIGKTYIYTEIHHIIPKHSNGSNDDVNLVEMLPEEHYMAHLIRYYAYDDRNDFISIRLMINGYIGKKYVNDIPVKTMNKMVKGFKQRIYEFRKYNEWHTKEGRKSISNSRKGTFPVIDSITRESMGSVSNSHPNIKSGKWIHHSSGMTSVTDQDGNKLYISSAEYQANKDIYRANVGDVSGELNPRYSGISDIEIINHLSEFSHKIDCGYIINYGRFRDFYEKYYNIKMPKSFTKFRFDGAGVEMLYNIVNKKTGLLINKYPRGLLNMEIKEKMNNLKRIL